MSVWELETHLSHIQKNNKKTTLELRGEPNCVKSAGSLLSRKLLESLFKRLSSFLECDTLEADDVSFKLRHFYPPK